MCWDFQLLAAVLDVEHIVPAVAGGRLAVAAAVVALSFLQMFKNPPDRERHLGIWAEWRQKPLGS